ncbi:hypothetical protein AGR2A_pa60063 [Agrobacterium genomosp. 2 str. CFBP 5494]|uniref:Uncharacterized protein n=1 Tax=Agrobacterium genomosp. 2 str. CFBP 5494 TaxID=1183436 RepID=A0A9W5B6Z8_9HYPH|nr:hypothetical protein AGR2A_pa60063 [Agrobacterium genomosp. 2 str. CFBP 5494]
MPGASDISLSELAIQFVCAAITVISVAANIVDKVTIRKSIIFRKFQCLRRGRADAVQAAPHYN